MPKIKYDCSGWLTKYGVKCIDGRTIEHGAFKHMDGKIVPLVYQHGHKDIGNVLGKMELEHRDEGVYAYAAFNDTQNGKDAKTQVEHGDLTMFSVFANQVKEVSKKVIHGFIREGSLVLSGANPEARIDNVVIAHDGVEYIEESEITFVGGETLTIKHSEPEEKTLEQVYDTMNEDQKQFVYSVAEGKVDIAHADEKTLGEIYQSMNEEQKEFVYAIAAQLASDIEQSDENKDSIDANASEEDGKEINHSDEGGNDMSKRNVFEPDEQANKPALKVLSHDELSTVWKDAISMGSLRKSVFAHAAEMEITNLDVFGLGEVAEQIIAHAGTYGIDDLDYLLPDGYNMVGDIQLDKRDTEWVEVFMGLVNKVPWSRIKSMYATLTEDEARAKGYVKGNEKYEEVFPLFKRTTDPTTIYKKQKLDNDDIIDIEANYAIVPWLKREMTMMLREETARAMLLGDGRDVTDQDKIDEDKIRPIWTDADIYNIKVQMESTVTGIDELEAIISGLEDYEGRGAVLFTTKSKMTTWRLLKDGNENYRFRNIQEVADFIGVKKIMDVDVMKNLTRDVDSTTYDLIGIIVGANAYTSGTDRGGKLKDYEQFDIDFNQKKYLKEGRASGAITKIKSCLTIEKAQAAG